MITSERLKSATEILEAWRKVTHQESREILPIHRIKAAILLESCRLDCRYHNSPSEIRDLMYSVVDNPIILRLFERRNRQITQK